MNYTEKDIKYFEDRLYSALGIPKELMGTGKNCISHDVFSVQPMTKPVDGIFYWNFKYGEKPCPFPEKLGVYILKEGYEINALSTLRMHIRWNGFQFICSDFRDRKGNIYYRQFVMGIQEPNVGYAWEHIEGGVD